MTLVYKRISKVENQTQANNAQKLITKEKENKERGFNVSL